MNINVVVGYNEYTKTQSRRSFECVDELPKDTYKGDEIISIDKQTIDIENSDDAFDYEYFTIYTIDSETKEKILEQQNSDIDIEKYCDKHYVAKEIQYNDLSEELDLTESIGRN